MEVTLAIIKPDALEAGFKNNILHTLQRKKFVILKQGRFKFTRLRAEEFYDDFIHEPYFETLIQYMMRRPIYVMVLSRGLGNCVRAFRNLMGPKDATKARQSHPKSLRALYGREGFFNGVHGSYSKEIAHREVKFFFPTLALEPPPSKEMADQYFESNIKNILGRGLCMLIRAKPGDTLTACKFLAEWLHENNPCRYNVTEEDGPITQVSPKIDPKSRPESPCCPYAFFPPCARG
ncbi:unnamed protein product [Calypogeia fissa]